NISCPNVNANFLAFGQDPKHVEELTAQIKKIAKQPVIMKLTPNVTDIAEIAKAAEAGGADAVSLINTLTGMKIDVNRRTFALANKTGGVSGPCIKRSEEHTSELQSRFDLVCRLLLEKKNKVTV